MSNESPQPIALPVRYDAETQRLESRGVGFGHIYGSSQEGEYVAKCINEYEDAKLTITGLDNIATKQRNRIAELEKEVERLKQYEPSIEAKQELEALRAEFASSLKGIRVTQKAKDRYRRSTADAALKGGRDGK